MENPNDEAKIINKSPEKMEDLLKAEQDHIQKTADNARKKEAEPDFYSIFSEQLVDLKDPIIVWVRGTIFENLGLNDLAALYKSKAAEMGYSVDENKNVSEKQEWHSGKIHTYKSVDGHTCLEALDAETSKALDQFFVNFVSKSSSTNESVVVDVTMDSNDAINGNIYREIDVKMPDYDLTALQYLINEDPFLRFAFDQLRTGELETDLDLMWKEHVKGEPALIQRMKQFESVLMRESSSNLIKGEVGEMILDAVKKLDTKFEDSVSKSELDNCFYQMSLRAEDKIPSLERSFEMMTSDAKVTIKNDISGFDYVDLAQVMGKAVSTWQDNKENVAARLKKITGWSQTTCDWLLKCFDISVKIVLPHTWIGGSGCTELTHIITAILAQSVC